MGSKKAQGGELTCPGPHRSLWEAGAETWGSERSTREIWGPPTTGSARQVPCPRVAVGGGGAPPHPSEAQEQASQENSSNMGRGPRSSASTSASSQLSALLVQEPGPAPL